MHGGHRKRLRERFQREGLDHFAPHEVIELLLTYALPQRDVNPLAHALLHEFGSVSAVLEADTEDLQRISGISENSSTFLSLIPQLTRYYALDKWAERPLIRNAKAAGEYCRALFAGRNHEAFYLLCLDSQLHLLYPALIMEGTINETPMYPRLAVAAAIRHRASNVVVTHNHPGGSPRASMGDIECTRRLTQAMRSVDILVNDHVIVAGSEVLCLSKGEGLDSAREMPLDLGMTGWPE